MSRRKCSVIGCENVKVDDSAKLFHKYSYVDKARVWIEWTNPGMIDYLNKSLSVSEYIICEDDFDRTHYQHPISKRLNRNALPTLHLPFGTPPFKNLDEVIHPNGLDVIITGDVDTKRSKQEKLRVLEEKVRTPKKSQIVEEDITSCYINISENARLEEITLEDPLQANPNPEIIKDEDEVNKPLVLPELTEVIISENIEEPSFLNECINVSDDQINKIIPKYPSSIKSKSRKKICRICFTTGDNLIDIFQVDIDKMNFYMKFRICFVDLEMEDTLMYNNVCEQCCLNIRQTYNFKLLCQESNARVISMSKANQLKEYCENENTFEEPLTTVEFLNLTYDVVELTESDALQIDEVPVETIIKREVINTMQLNLNHNNNEHIIISNLSDVDKGNKSKMLTMGDDHKQIEIVDKLENEVIKNEERVNELEIADNLTVENSNVEESKMENRTVNPLLKFMKCSFCQHQFFSLDILQKHMRNHLTINGKTTVKLYKCSYCTSKFLNIMSLAKHRQVVHKTMKQISHMKSAREKNMLKCSQCPKVCDMPSQLKKHEEMHVRRARRLARRKELFLCEVCGKTFKYKKTYQLHTARHSDLKPFICETCGKAFRFEANLKSHISLHSDVKPFVCETCGKLFRLKGTLRTHLRFHTGEKPYQCHICDKRFRVSSSYKSHLRRHTGERPFKCPFEGCTEEYIDRTHLNRHKLKMHICKKEHICIECGASFYYRFALKRHELLHGDQTKHFVCDICRKSFLHATSLKKHSKTHELSRPYNCETCGKAFKQPTYLKYHQEKIHKKKWELHPKVTPECLICNRTFQSEHTLKWHMKIHQKPKDHSTKVDNDDDEKTYACNYCDKKFKNDSHLKVHTRLHTQERPFKCETCDKTFTQSIGLKLHIFTHTGEKIYSCEMCNKKYRQPGHLQSHRNWHYGIKPHECTFCRKKYSQKRDLRLHMEKMHGYQMKSPNLQIQSNDELSQSSSSYIRDGLTIMLPTGYELVASPEQMDII